MKQLITELRSTGTFVCAKDESEDYYQIVYNQTEDGIAAPCDGVLLDRSVPFDANKFEITDVKTQFKPT